MYVGSYPKRWTNWSISGFLFPRPIGPNADFSLVRPSVESVDPIMIFWNLMFGSSSAQRASILVKSGIRTSLPAAKAVAGLAEEGRSAGTGRGRGWKGIVAGSVA